jgi:hypothetical protein
MHGSCPVLHFCVQWRTQLPVDKFKVALDAGLSGPSLPLTVPVLAVGVMCTYDTHTQWSQLPDRRTGNVCLGGFSGPALLETPPALRAPAVI